jgi:hypothetical protein
MRALFETLPVGPGEHLMLVYRAKNRDQIVFRRKLDALAARRQARVIYLLGGDPNLLSARSLTRLVPGLPDRDEYLCAPPSFPPRYRGGRSHPGRPALALRFAASSAARCTDAYAVLLSRVGRLSRLRVRPGGRWPSQRHSSG